MGITDQYPDHKKSFVFYKSGISFSSLMKIVIYSDLNGKFSFHNDKPLRADGAPQRQIGD